MFGFSLLFADYSFLVGLILGLFWFICFPGGLFLICLFGLIWMLVLALCLL